jgi:alpha-beta hydrolase superfamily lysophospholipase
MRIEIRQAMLRSQDGTLIHARAWVSEEPERVLVCVQGLGGHGGYYESLAHQLAPEGTVVVALDLRGHGHSEGRRGDIDRFDRYLEDVDAAISWGQACWPEKPLILLGESMGASIAIQYIARYRGALDCMQAASIAGLVLISPVLRAAIRPTMREVARYMRSLILAPSRPTIPVTGREELGCRDSDFNDRLRADPLFVRLVSVRYLNNLTRWLWQTRRKAGSVQIPLLVLQGKQDYVAHPAGTAAFLRQVPVKSSRLVTFPEAYHCLLYDPDTPSVVKTLTAWLVEEVTVGAAGMVL